LTGLDSTWKGERKEEFGAAEGGKHPHAHARARKRKSSKLVFSGGGVDQNSGNRGCARLGLGGGVAPHLHLGVVLVAL